MTDGGKKKQKQANPSCSPLQPPEDWKSLLLFKQVLQPHCGPPALQPCALPLTQPLITALSGTPWGQGAAQSSSASSRELQPHCNGSTALKQRALLLLPAELQLQASPGAEKQRKKAMAARQLQPFCH